MMMRVLAALSLVLGLIVPTASIAPVRAAEGQCTAQYVLAPDRTSLTILFDNMTVNGQGQLSCPISVNLDLPANTSLGVYRMDYRGYAMLQKKEVATLRVAFDLGPKGNGRTFKRSVRGATDEDFTFSENIGAGQMKRVGCGTDAKLTGTVSLQLDGGANATATLDSGDGASKRGIVYLFDLKRC